MRIRWPTASAIRPEAPGSVFRLRPRLAASVAVSRHTMRRARKNAVSEREEMFVDDSCSMLGFFLGGTVAPSPGMIARFFVIGIERN